jgi:type IV pilus assembly protein PilM
MWNFFKAASKNCLGIDIGTSSIRIVEISSAGKKRKLENYGELCSKIFSEKPFKAIQQNSCVLSSKEIAKIILAVNKEAKIKTTKAVFSIPDFSSFFTWFDLPPMSEEELSSAVQYEARHHIPFPLSEVVLDWQIIKGKISKKNKENLKILLVSVPKKVINQYKEVAILAKLELLAMEAEVFGLARALILSENFGAQFEKNQVVPIIDIGAQSTTVSIIDNGVLKISHSFDMAGNGLTERLAQGFNLDSQKAEGLKQKYGFIDNPEFGKEIRKILLPLVDLILVEIQKVCRNFQQVEGKKVQKIIIAGGTAIVPGLKEYFSKYLNTPIEIADPFSTLSYPSILEDRLKKIGPLYAVAAGAAMRGIE